MTRETHFSFACGSIIERDAGQIFKSNWIGAEDLRRYEDITRFFKIVGRDMMPSKVLRCTEACLDESYDGNLFDLLCSSIGYYGIEFRAHIDNQAAAGQIFQTHFHLRNRQCQRCAYCAELADEFLGYGWITREMLEDAKVNVDDRRHRDVQFGGTYSHLPLPFPGRPMRTPVQSLQPRGGTLMSAQAKNLEPSIAAPRASPHCWICPSTTVLVAGRLYRENSRRVRDPLSTPSPRKAHHPR
ncbi:MAG: hypothetical protein ACLTDR_15115 [Adlercreutzia equolifaciens]